MFPERKTGATISAPITSSIIGVACCFSGSDTPELWDQSTGTAWKAPEIDLGDGGTLVLEYT